MKPNPWARRPCSISENVARVLDVVIGSLQGLRDDIASGNRENVSERLEMALESHDRWLGERLQGDWANEAEKPDPAINPQPLGASDRDRANVLILRNSVSFYCYILECADGTYYTGWTTDPERRLKQHNKGTAARYTRSRLPVKMVYLEPQPDRATAMKRERAIKRLSREKKKEIDRVSP